ncbi:hypothetical protein [Paraburkholderia sp. HP33-1]|uniref:hypothetical protein n=1 Tax=Paraburkholderia sp. HP33-1 TaxID=2883243 RepID=UPI001F38267F|nr:hypothetical protein [Paraburkholderia sp. HP33-1]
MLTTDDAEAVPLVDPADDEPLVLDVDTFDADPELDAAAEPVDPAVLWLTACIDIFSPG